MSNISENISTLQYAGEPLAEDILRSEWVFVLLIVPVLIYMLVSLFEKYSLNRIIKIVFSNKFAYAAFRNISAGTQVFQMLLGVLSLISISTFILFCELHFNIVFFDLSPPLLWLADLAAISVLIGLRYVVNAAVGSVSGATEAFREYFFNLSRAYKLIGISLMIMNFFISYLTCVPDKYLIYFSLSLVALIMFFRLIKLIYIFVRRRFSLFYLILYLCALEFFPILALIRYLDGLK